MRRHQHDLDQSNAGFPELSPRQIDRRLRVEKRVAIVGSGPAGLCLARALSPSGAKIALIDSQEAESLENPGFDGREIALTQRSVAVLKELGVWDRIGADKVFALREARVFDGKSPFPLRYGSNGEDDRLGCIVSNCDIRKAAFEAASECENVELIAGTSVVSLDIGDRMANVSLSDGRELSAPLLIAADSRFSFVRNQLGIGAEMNRLGKAMLVGRVRIDTPHDNVATEWFDHGQTLALLPLGAGMASAVLTVSEGDASRILALDPDALGQELHRRFRGRFGTMDAIGPMHAYPLTTVFARRFVCHRAALVGDAAVGMHPVTAHGFNLGIASVRHLTDEILPLLERGADPANSAALRRYERRHRRESLPIYLATNSIVGLYTDDRLIARAARRFGLRVAQTPPAHKIVNRILMRPQAKAPRLRLPGIGGRLRMG